MKKVLSLALACVLAITAMCVANVEAAAVPEGKAKVTIHFQKFAGAYEGAAVYNWIGLENPAGAVAGQNTFEFDGEDDFGATLVAYIDKTKTLEGDAGQIIVFDHGMPAGTTNLADWNALNAADGGRIGTDGHNIAFDAKKFNAALATGEINLWYLENMFLESTFTTAKGTHNFEMAVSDGSEAGMAAAKAEATKYWSGDAIVHDKWNGVENATISGKHGYSVEGQKTIVLAVATVDATKAGLLSDDNPCKYQIWQWGTGLGGDKQPYNVVAGEDSIDMSQIMIATYKGVTNYYGIYYMNLASDATGAGLGFKMRGYGAWASQTSDWKKDTITGIDTWIDSITDVAYAAFLYGDASVDLRMGAEKTVEWVSEINGIKVTDAEFLTPTSLQFNVTKEIPVKSITDIKANVIVMQGTTKLEMEKVFFDDAAKTVKGFRVELKNAIDLTKEYTVKFEITLDEVDFFAEAVTVEKDTTAPEITCNAKVTIEMCSGKISMPTVTITDNNDGTIANYTVVTGEGVNSSVDTGTPGEYKVTIQAVDKMGNVATKDITFTVVDPNAKTANANVGLVLLGLLPVAVAGVAVFKKFAM